MKAVALFNSRNVQCGKTYNIEKKVKDTMFMENTIVLSVNSRNGPFNSYCFGEDDFRLKWKVIR